MAGGLRSLYRCGGWAADIVSSPLQLGMHLPDRKSRFSPAVVFLAHCLPSQLFTLSLFSLSIVVIASVVFVLKFLLSGRCALDQLYFLAPASASAAGWTISNITR